MSAARDDDSGTPPPAPAPGHGPSLRLMTWNLHGLAPQGGASRGAVSAAAVAVVRAARPDVLALQEPPLGMGGRRRLRRFAARAGLRVAAGGRDARTALLVAPGVTVAGAHTLPMPWRAPQVQRSASLARLDGVLVAVVHLGLRVDERDEQMAHVLAALRTLGAWTGARSGAVVLAGDLNAPPTGRAWQQAHAVGLRDALAAAPAPSPATSPAPDPAADPGWLTFPAVAPTHRIDAVLVGAALRVLAARVPDDPAVAVASDHRPVVVDLVSLPGGVL